MPVTTGVLSRACWQAGNSGPKPRERAIAGRLLGGCLSMQVCSATRTTKYVHWNAVTDICTDGRKLLENRSDGELAKALPIGLWMPRFPGVGLRGQEPPSLQGQGARHSPASWAAPWPGAGTRDQAQPHLLSCTLAWCRCSAGAMSGAGEPGMRTVPWAQPLPGQTLRVCPLFLSFERIFQHMSQTGSEH